METAKEFATQLDGMIEGVDEEGVQMAPEVIAAIEARDAAVALAAKRELLEEIRDAATEWRTVKAPCEWKSAYNGAVAKYTQAQQKESGEQMSKLGDKYCDGMFRAERCPGSGGECHDDKRPNHLTGYIVCDCGFRCESNDVAAKQRHHGGLN